MGSVPLELGFAVTLPERMAPPADSGG
jgi:hypothetical protein